MQTAPEASMTSDTLRITAGPSDSGRDCAGVARESTMRGRPVAYSWSGAPGDSVMLDSVSLRPVGPTSTTDKPPEFEADGGNGVNSTNPAESAVSSGPLAMHCVLAQLWASDSLSTDISADILRGVSIRIVLEGFAKAFSGNVGSQSEFLKSGPVKRLSDFISHDWASKRSGKLAALTMVHNSKAALIISMCVGLVFTALQSESVIGVLPYPVPDVIDHKVGGWGCWCQCVCPIVFVYILIYWQAIRVKLGFPAKRVFLDKLCVDQVNPQKKAEAILGLAGFLNNTDRLVICWTQRYFTRLWCVYEIASWLHLRKPLDSVVFMPLALAKSVLALCLSQVCATISFALGQYIYGLSEVVVIVAIFVIGPWYTHSCRHMIHDLRNLPRQLQNFCMDTAECFCCTVNHKMPGTGQELQCDRQIVCRTVKKWFPRKCAELRCSRVTSTGESSMNTESSVKHFDERVRELFGPFILQRAGPTQIRYKYCVIIGIPYMWRLLDVMVAFPCWDVPILVKMSKVVEYFVCTFGVIPTTTKLTLWYILFLDKTIGVLRNPVLDWLLSSVFFLPQGFLIAASSVLLATSLDARNWFMFYGECGFFMVTTFFFFFPWRRFAFRKEVFDDDIIEEEQPEQQGQQGQPAQQGYRECDI